MTIEEYRATLLPVGTLVTWKWFWPPETLFRITKHDVLNSTDPYPYFVQQVAIADYGQYVGLTDVLPVDPRHQPPLC